MGFNWKPVSCVSPRNCFYTSKAAPSNKFRQPQIRISSQFFQANKFSSNIPIPSATCVFGFVFVFPGQFLCSRSFETREMKSLEPNWWNFPAGFEVPLDLHKVPAEGAAAQSLMEASLNAAVTEGEGSMHTAVANEVFTLMPSNAGYPTRWMDILFFNYNQNPITS